MADPADPDRTPDLVSAASRARAEAQAREIAARHVQSELRPAFEAELVRALLQAEVRGRVDTRRRGDAEVEA